jgi:hypothetical protein
MNKLNRYKPTVNISAIEPVVNEMTYTEVIKTSFTFTVEQLRLISTTDLKREYRSAAIAVVAGLIKKYKFELFQSCDGYRIITNGYGQFKRVELDGVLNGEKKTYDAKLIFRKLKVILDK